MCFFCRETLGGAVLYIYLFFLLLIIDSLLRSRRSKRKKKKEKNGDASRFCDSLASSDCICSPNNFVFFFFFFYFWPITCRLPSPDRRLWWTTATPISLEKKNRIIEKKIPKEKRENERCLLCFFFRISLDFVSSSAPIVCLFFSFFGFIFGFFVDSWA